MAGADRHTTERQALIAHARELDQLARAMKAQAAEARARAFVLGQVEEQQAAAVQRLGGQAGHVAEALDCSKAYAKSVLTRARSRRFHHRRRVAA